MPKSLHSLTEIGMPRKGRSSWKGRVWCNGTQAKDGDKKTPLKRPCWNFGFCPCFLFQSSSVESTTSSTLALRHGSSTLNSQVPQKFAYFGPKNKHFQQQWQHEGFTVPTSQRSSGASAAQIICFVLSTTTHPGGVSPSQPARHKIFTSFLFHYKFKIYLEKYKKPAAWQTCRVRGRELLSVPAVCKSLW